MVKSCFNIAEGLRDILIGIESKITKNFKILLKKAKINK